jgi:serine/threonine protein kinase
VAELFSVTSRAGTPSYLAPERFRGSALSERTEIFAIGVTLYEALARSFPYGEIERFQTPKFEYTPKPLTKLNKAVPAWLDHLIQRAISADPTRRYQNFSEVVYDLDHPDEVRPHHSKDVPLIERNPLVFYKLLSLGLFVVCVILLIKLAHA